MTENLLRCPFCGHQPFIDMHIDNIYCSNEKCKLYETNPSGGFTVEQWNMRHLDGREANGLPETVVGGNPIVPS
jgi:hypothetical protein